MKKRYLGPALCIVDICAKEGMLEASNITSENVNADTKYEENGNTGDNGDGLVKGDRNLWDEEW